MSEAPRRRTSISALRLRGRAAVSRIATRYQKGGLALGQLLADARPLDMRILGRTLLHAALVGIAAGLSGSAFFAALEWSREHLLEGVVGVQSIRAFGEGHETAGGGDLRPWLLAIVPALGAALGGVLVRFAPECAGGGGDAIISAFHKGGGDVRGRVIPVKALASIFTLGTGGSGGREGPTMQIGGALGALVARVLRVGPREKRILLVAGIAAGISAVFRTPLGAALLAVEVLWRDDFEAEALVPAVLASVVSYSISITLLGETILFARAVRYPFVPALLPLYAALALGESLLAVLFLLALRFVREATDKLPGPSFLRPAFGGLGVGLLALLVVVEGATLFGGGREPGILGSGYGAAQAAITSASWLGEGFDAVLVLLLLCGAKLVASALTIGSGGSAGDFAPSLVLGALFGGAFGQAAKLLFDPSIDPGAFALVGMGTFYGGVAHVPLAALILVSELAGSYDLLVPLMLAGGIAFVALRRWRLYHAQPDVRSAAAPAIEDPVPVSRALAGVPSLAKPEEPLTAILSRFGAAAPVAIVDRRGHPVGVLSEDVLREAASERGLDELVVAADVMARPVTAHGDEDLRQAALRMLSAGAHHLVVVDASGALVGLVGEAALARTLGGSPVAEPPAAH